MVLEQVMSMPSMEKSCHVGEGETETVLRFERSGCCKTSIHEVNVSHYTQTWLTTHKVEPLHENDTPSATLLKL